MIAFDNFENYINSKQAYTVKEENLVEVLLPPLPEQNDQINLLNDIDDILKIQNLSKDHQQVLYLDSDEVLEDSHPSNPNHQPAFLQDDGFDSEANFDGVIRSGKIAAQNGLNANNVQKNNLLSEITEEETDVVSMVSERRAAGAAGAQKSHGSGQKPLRNAQDDIEGHEN